MFEDGFFIGQSDAESTDPEFGYGFQKVAKFVHQERQIDGVHAERDKAGVVKNGRKRMADRIANHSIDLRVSIHCVTAIQMKHFIQGHLARSGCLCYRGISKFAAVAQRENASWQSHFPHWNGYKVPGTTSDL